MTAALLLAQATMLAPAGPVEAAVPATAWSCRLTDAQGATTEVSGKIPELPKGRDPNRSIFARQSVAGVESVHGITGEVGGEWMRDYQLTHSEGEATLVLNLRLRRDSEGVAWLTRYDPSLGAKRQPYRYVSAGLCTADFAPSTGTSQ
ncbi:MAG: hypothetical protein ABW203_07700 [Novosphingobium sp.]